MFVTLFFIFGVLKEPPQKKIMYWMKIGRKINFQSWTFRDSFFLAVQASSISDIVGLSVSLSEPANNQSLGSIKEWP